jgi:hypothetical protein
MRDPSALPRTRAAFAARVGRGTLN